MNSSKEIVKSLHMEYRYPSRKSENTLETKPDLNIKYSSIYFRTRYTAEFKNHWYMEILISQVLGNYLYGIWILKNMKILKFMYCMYHKYHKKIIFFIYTKKFYR